MKKWTIREDDCKQMLRSIISKIVKIKVLIIVTAIVWKTSHPWWLKQILTRTDQAYADHHATEHNLLNQKNPTNY